VTNFPFQVGICLPLCSQGAENPIFEPIGATQGIFRGKELRSTRRPQGILEEKNSAQPEGRQAPHQYLFGRIQLASRSIALSTIF
jgi:hypothetical protein